MSEKHAPAFEVVRHGIQATVQDRGRTGYAAVGVPRAGAMDQFAHVAANLLVGNDPDAATLEILLGGLHLRALAPFGIALAGADLGATLDGTPLANWSAHDLRPGALLQFNSRVWGARGSLAVRGGIAVAPVLGSRSTYLPGGWGGYEGRAIRTGDVLNRGTVAHEREPIMPFREHQPPYSRFPTLRCVVGPHHAAFDPAALDAFFATVYRLSPACDRMGYRLEGAAIHADEPALPSLGVLAGCVQIPPNGQPIILMADAQTTGGYPIIATVIGPDLPLAAQLLPGDGLRFQPVTLAAALAITRSHDADLHAPAEEVVGTPI